MDTYLSISQLIGVILTNILILGSVASGKNELLSFYQKCGYTTIDTGILYRAAAYFILQEYQKNKSQSSLAAFISKKSQLIFNKLKSHLIVKNNMLAFENLSADFAGKLYTPAIINLLKEVAANKNIRLSIKKWLYQNVGNNQNLAITGHNIKEFNTTIFKPICLTVDNETAAQRLTQRNPQTYQRLADAYAEVTARNDNDKFTDTVKVIKESCKPIIIDTSHLSAPEVFEKSQQSLKSYQEEIAKNESGLQIKRDDFAWLKNPFYEKLKREILQTNLYNQALDYGINAQDLVIQTLTNISRFAPQEIFYDAGPMITELEKNLKDRKIDKLLWQRFQNVEINQDLLQSQLGIEAQILRQLYQKSGHENALIALNTQNPFATNRRGIIETLNAIEKEENGKRILVVHERKSRQQVIFRRVDAQTSKMITQNLHYLHSPRKDEFMAFGAFYEDSQVPFALTSFSKHDRDYKKMLLEYNNIESHNTLEMTRAWCAPWTPKNTMSALFQYAFDELAQQWQRNKELGLSDKNLAAITTTINPNLGFNGFSFSACNFVPIALRPAEFTFYNDRYATRRQIAELNKKNHGDNIISYVQNSSSKIYNLPLNELIVCFNKADLQQVMSKNIISVNKKVYQNISEKNYVKTNPYLNQQSR